MSQGKQWLLKHKSGRIEGPLSVDQIIDLITDNTIQGEESIALYPSDRWTAISSEHVFYEAFMASLSKTQINKDHSVSTIDPKASQFDSSKTVIVDQDAIKIIKEIQKKKKKKKTISKKTVIYQLPEEHLEKVDGVLDNKESKIKNLFSKKNILFFSITICFISFAVSFLENTNVKNINEYIELKRPKKNKPLISPKQSKILANKGLYFYLKDTVPSYVKAQNLLVQSIEGSPKNTYYMALLCLVYLELWPFTKQDYKSTRIISYLIKKTSLLNKGGVRSGLCHGVDLLIKGKYVDAKTIVESSLDGLNEGIQDTQSRKLIPLFYYLKIKSLYYLNNYNIIISYLDSIQKSIPIWIAPYMLTADILLKQNKPTQALRFYKKVIKLNSTHKVAKIKIGFIEYQFFKKLEKAENILTIALNYPEIVSHHILSEAYFSLAKINMVKRNSVKALKYARLAYSYNPALEASKNLVIQLGGIKKLKQTPVRSRQLVYKADQLVLNNNFQEAILYYEEAFKIDRGKNARVAIKIAKNYWKLSLFNQAIKWLKKAINANANIMESYILMAEYYSEQYDFYNAEKILRIAAQKTPKSYELYRGKAYLAFKRHNYYRVIQYAKIALSIYEADIESHVILSSAYSKLGNLNESLVSATRGLEIDPNSIKTQIAYAKSLGGVSGIETGENYFRKLVENYPLVIEYRMEWMKYLFQDEQYNKAQQIVLEIIKIQASYKEAFFYLGRILMFNNDFKGAYEAFLQAAIFNPSTPLPTFYIGLLRLKEKRYNLAKDQFIKVLSLNKLYPKAHYHLGEIAFFKKNYKEAIKEARLESQFNPNAVLPYLLAGKSYEKLKQFLNCAGEYQKVIEVSPNNMNVYVKIARCYRQAGHLDLAIKILKKAGGDDNVNEQSGDPQLYKELGIIYDIKQSHPEALSSYCNYLNLVPRALDRRVIENRMNKLYKITGIKQKKCG